MQSIYFSLSLKSDRRTFVIHTCNIKWCLGRQGWIMERDSETFDVVHFADIMSWLCFRKDSTTAFGDIKFGEVCSFGTA